MERRKFIKNISLATAAGIVVPTIIPSSVLGKGVIAPSDRINLALIGCVGMGHADISNLLKLNGVECVALCDVHEKRLEEEKEKLKAEGYSTSQKEFEDYRDLISWGKFDAAVIAVPDHWHAKLYTEFARNKFDVYGEKPLVRKVREGRLVSDTVHENNIIWQTGSWQRSTENFVKASELVNSGVLGEVKYVEVGLPDFNQSVGMPPVRKVPKSLNYDMWVGPAPKNEYRGILHGSWRWIMEYSGGQMTDWIGHHLDIALWAMDMDQMGPVEVEGKATFKKGDYFDVPHDYMVKARFSNGVEFKIANASQLDHGMGACWYGEKGWIHVKRGGQIYTSDEKMLTASIPASLTKFRHGDNGHWDNFIQGVRTRKAPIANVEAAHRAISVGLLGEIAYLTGEKLKWNPDTEQFIGASAEANALLTRTYRTPYTLKGL